MSSILIPVLRYADAPAAVDWLASAFGFERHLVVPDENGGIAHAQLTLGGGMIMLASAEDSEFGRLMRLARQVGGCTQSTYVVVRDVDRHCERARTGGAEIVMEPVDQDYGGRGYTCKDLEGNVWSFGSYDPWATAH